MSTPDTRDLVERAKADWLKDPCYDLVALADDFPEYRDELAAFEAEHTARWKAQREAEHAAKIDAIQGRILGRLEPQYRPPPPGIAGLIRSFAEEVHELEQRLRGVDNKAGSAHERLDQIGARGADSERQ